MEKKKSKNLIVVEFKKENLFTTSLNVAKNFKKEHKNVLRDIENLECSANFRRLNFEPSIYINLQKREQKMYYLTRDGFSFLAFGFTGKKAMEFKELYIAKFNEMEKQLIKALKNNTDPNWIKQREKSKLTRLEETDIIKEFVSYATYQGSKSAKFYYKHFTMSTYKALDLIKEKKPKLRETLDYYETSELILTERLAQNLLKKYMEQGLFYKDIYELVKNDLLNFGETLQLSRSNKINLIA